MTIVVKCKHRTFRDYQVRPCSRKASKDGFCKQHHPEEVKRRREQSRLRYEEKMDNSPIARLQRRVDELEAENRELRRK